MRHANETYPSVRPFLAHATAATLAVVLFPVAVVYALLTVAEPDPPLLAVASLGVLLALGAVVAGTALWMRQPQSAFIGFSDLMVWRWMQRRRAERNLVEGTALLGLDRAGHPVSEVRITPEQQLQVLKDLTASLETKDPYTHGHSQRVERHCYRTAQAMGLAAADIEDVRKAAALHDVGKIRVPDRILRKEGPLSSTERLMIQEHSVVGAWMVSSVGNADVIAGVRHHHEAWDGTGYPDGISGTDIPLFARIIAVADCYDAINSTRPYRASLGRDRATEVLQAEAGRQFDPEVVRYFLAALPTRLPIAAGSLLLLAGPSRLARGFFAWLRRFGAGSVSPAIGAAGAAVVLGASTFAPNLPVDNRRVEVAVAQEQQDVVAVRVPAPKKKTPKPAPRVEKRARTAVVAAPAPAEVLGTRFVAPESAMQPAEPGPSIDGVRGDPRAPEPRPEPAPQPEPEPEPEPEPTPQPTPEPEPTYEPEPEPEDDGDCAPGHEESKGKGHEKNEHSGCH